MKLVWRRARAARGLLIAAIVAALVSIGLVTGLSDFNRRAVDAGQRSVLAASPPEERSLLLSGAGGRDAAEFADRDRAVRGWLADGFGGAPVSVVAARSGTGRELTGDLGTVARQGDDPVFASLALLDDLAGHADLTAGSWPVDGATPMQVTIPERVAATLGLTVGERVPLRDRSTEKTSQVVVAGTWRARDPGSPYWRLAPGANAAPSGSDTSYGPFALSAADFARTFPGSTSASWLIAPDLGDVEPGRLDAVRAAVTAAGNELPTAAGLGSSAQTVTAMDQLIDRLGRADLVGRSALLTPLLLIVVLGGYALLLVAALLHEDRRAQTALLRARGAARVQLAGLAAREATLVVLPAVLVAPFLAGEALHRVRPAGAGGVPLPAGNTVLVWAVALAAAAGCLLAMVAPTLRGARSYVADMAAASRPDRSATVQRAGVDLALVALAVLAWTQLRQYSGPLTGRGGLGVDPLLVAAPTIGVLAGAVVALRLLPPVTRFAERFVDRRPWTATMFGMWQAGRRPHAGPVLLLALAVGSSTLAWSLVTTGERSHLDQADHTVGADLRVTERNGTAPADRAGELRALTGARTVLPAWRDEVRLGPKDLPTTVVALDAAQAGGVVRLDDRLADEPVPALYQRLARARGAPAGVDLPPGARRISGTVATPVERAAVPHPVRLSLLLTSPEGLAYRLPLGTADSSGRPVRFAVDLPDVGPGTLRLAGFEGAAGDALGTAYGLRVAGLRVAGADGAARPLQLPGGWRVATEQAAPNDTATATGDGLTSRHNIIGLGDVQYISYDRSRFTVVPDGTSPPVPALISPQVRAALSLRDGDTLNLQLSGATVPVKVVGEVAALPSAAGAGILLDLPTATDWLVRERGGVRPVSEWWLATDPGGHEAAAGAAQRLTGVTVADRRATAEAAARDPYWLGARTGLLAAALGCVLLALVGLGVDVWATARRRLAEYAVLNTLGATPRLLARALLAEQAFLAGIGVGVGLLLGTGVGATMAPLLILTPAAGRPVPEAAFVLPWTPIGLTALGLLLTALGFSAAIALGIRQRVAAAQLRIGGDQ
ncbi:FtsX-like permease family protein [Micromonospora mirobrigensis]|uniref:FtsX-like permease family protein n=1 Tax=Micromonospora mirobrigensis TaxID=262898 RepID=A0A1C5A1A7_9ACTN|nr:FtsX-like permease family protein [Micromonospora mirobrigensis]SCF39010.1 FtsX-like permease family protein [Micromonospora mirobrigensis]